MDGTPYSTDRDGNPNVFNVNRNDDGLWLDNNWAKPDNEWNPDNQFVFRLRNYFFSVPPAAGRFFLLGLFKLPFQPPNILPISSSLRATLS